SYEGRDVGNLYLYDAQGRRLQDVRVYDDLGHLVLLSRTGDVVRPDLTVPGVRDADGHEWLNVFPRPWTVDGGPYEQPPVGTVYPVWSPPTSIAPLVTATAPPTPTPSATTR
ncbi:hypothetical protein, partial [Enterobacter ludwigii]|uniref:hypothetical protein n=1 Tax=Enterobacter ludwigii TaxID=299767 RepID=UPI001CAA87D2